MIKVIKTYAWINETPNSNTERIIIKGNEDSMIGEDRQKFPKSLINKCPATMLADKRTDRVIGRIMFLTNSISTMKFISWDGVPEGTMWAIIEEKFLDHPKIIKDIHIVNLIVKEIDKWAVGVNENGVKAIRFINKQ